MPDESSDSEESRDPHNASYLDRIFRFGLGDGSFRNTQDLERIKTYLIDEIRKRMIPYHERQMYGARNDPKTQLLHEVLTEIYGDISTIQLPAELDRSPEVHDPYLKNIYIAIFVTVLTTSTPPSGRLVYKYDNNGRLYPEPEVYVDDYENVLYRNADLAIQKIQQLKTYLSTMYLPADHVLQ